MADNTPREALSHRTDDSGAFAVFSGQVVNQAMARNQEMRAENDALQSTRDFLLKVQVQRNEEDIWTGCVLDCKEQEEEDDFLVLSTGDNAVPIPLQLDELIGLSCTIRGFPTQKSRDDFLTWGMNQFCTVKEQTVELTLRFGGSCFLVGTMENFSTSIEYVREMIWENRLAEHIQSYATLNETNNGEERTENRDARVQGSTFHLRTIKIAKTAIQPILNQESIDTTDEVNNDEQVKELQKLAMINEVNRDVRVALEELTTSFRANILGKVSRDTVQEVRVSHPDGDMVYNLCHGRRISPNYTDTDRPMQKWLLEIPSEEDGSKIKRSNIGRMQISFSGVPMSANFQGTSRSGTFIRVPYNEQVTAVFDLLVPKNRNFADMIDFIANSDPDTFWRLAALEVDVGVVSNALCALGVEDDGEYETQEGQLQE